MKIRLLVTGRNYNTTDSLPDELQLDNSATLEDALKTIADKMGDDQLPASCLIAVSGQRRDRDIGAARPIPYRGRRGEATPGGSERAPIEARYPDDHHLGR